MKTRSAFGPAVPLAFAPGRRRWGGALVVLGLVALGGAASAEQGVRKQVESIDAPERDHHLFVGVNLFVREGARTVPVRLIGPDGSLVETEAGTLEQRPVTDGFVWRKTAKVAPVAVQIGQVKEQRVYSAVANPRFEWESQQASLLEYFTTRQSLADREMRYLEARIKSAETARAQGEYAPSAAELTAQTFDNVAGASADMERFNTNVAPDQPGVERGDGELYDGLVLAFEASAPQMIADVCAVVMVRIRNRNQEYQDYNYSEPLGAIGPDPREVRIAQFNLPPGFELVESQIHLFSRGEEIPTNRSERHLALSAAEAREFALQSHLAEHRGRSAPAAVAWSLAPSTLRGADGKERFDHAATVRLDEAGDLVAIEDDGAAVLPEPVRSVLEELVYLPALEDGQAVAGTLTVNPWDYFMPIRR